MLCLPWVYLTHAVLYFANNCHTLSSSFCSSGLAGHFEVLVSQKRWLCQLLRLVIALYDVNRKRIRQSSSETKVLVVFAAASLVHEPFGNV